MAGVGYDTVQSKDKDYLQYFFISKGSYDIIKTIEYRFVSEYKSKRVYNLGFGDYDIISDKIIDSVISDNGDHYKVFNTVLNTIPVFFENIPDGILIIQGSDSSEDFVEKCKLICKKNCLDAKPICCKNRNRRITLYNMYVAKNFETLSTKYLFQGGNLQANGNIILEEYITNKNYDSVLVQKKY